MRYKIFTLFFFLLIADDINYDVKFIRKTWSADLADKQSQGFKDFKDKIVQDVRSTALKFGGEILILFCSDDCVRTFFILP